VADGSAAPLMNYMPPAAAAEAQTVIDRAAREAGRDTHEAIIGPPDHWAEVLTHLALDHGFGTFVLLGEPHPDAADIHRGRRAEGPRARRHGLRL
jgi:hypothetical protein